MTLEDLSVGNVSELVAAVVEIRDVADGRRLWFRGMECEMYSLMPSLMRNRVSMPDVFEVEKRLLARYRQQSLPYWPAGYGQTDWEHLFSMQHHGVPTRLLDWSENLMVAAFFAVRGNCGHDPSTSAVWCIDPVAWNGSVPHLADLNLGVLTTVDEGLESYAPEKGRLLQRHKMPVALYGTHNSARIVAQRGTFTIAGDELDPLENYANKSDAPILWKIRLDAGRESLLAELDAVGLTETMIYPDLLALGRELRASEGM